MFAAGCLTSHSSGASRLTFCSSGTRFAAPLRAPTARPATSAAQSRAPLLGLFGGHGGCARAAAMRGGGAVVTAAVHAQWQLPVLSVVPPAPAEPAKHACVACCAWLRLSLSARLARAAATTGAVVARPATRLLRCVFGRKSKKRPQPSELKHALPSLYRALQQRRLPRRLAGVSPAVCRVGAQPAPRVRSRFCTCPQNGPRGLLAH